MTGKPGQRPGPSPQDRATIATLLWANYPTGTLLLAYAVLTGYDESGLILRKSFKFDGPFVICSSDSGTTWTKPVKVPRVYPEQLMNVSPYGKIVQLANGTVLMITYYINPAGENSVSYLSRSKDGGHTWGDASLVAEGFNETSLAVMPTGKLIAAMRSGDKTPHLGLTYSDDQGRTWSAPVAVTADREAPGDLIALKDGSLLLSYGVSRLPRGARALLSQDQGKTWNRRVILADDVPCNGEVVAPMYRSLPRRLRSFRTEAFSPRAIASRDALWTMTMSAQSVRKCRRDSSTEDVTHLHNLLVPVPSPAGAATLVQSTKSARRLARERPIASSASP